MGQKHGEWLRRPCQNYRPLLIDACVESLASTGLPQSAMLTCGKPQGKHLWDKRWQAENGHGGIVMLSIIDNSGSHSPCILIGKMEWEAIRKLSEICQKLITNFVGWPKLDALDCNLVCSVEQ